MNALLSWAEGGYVTETKALKLRDKHGNERIEIAEVQRYIQPDTQAIIFWLTNREREHWNIYKPVEHPRRRLLLRTYRRRVEKLLKRCIRFCTS